MACAITQFEAGAATVPDLLPTLAQLEQTIGAQLAPYYWTVDGAGRPREVLHYFWVQVVACAGCGERVEAHPHHQLAYDAEGTQQWAFCPRCHAVQACDRAAPALTCSECGTTAAIEAGPVRFGRLTCPRCGTRERLIDVAVRTSQPPAWSLFAVEYLDQSAAGSGRAVPLRRRSFQRATAEDLATFEAAADALAARHGPDGALAWVPDRPIPVEQRADDRLPRYGVILHDFVCTKQPQQ